MSVISMKQLLEAGVHFGHQTRRWNLKWLSTSTQNQWYLHYRLTEVCRNGRYSIQRCKDIVAKGGNILFCWYKKQAQDSIKAEAERCGMFYVNEMVRWYAHKLQDNQTRIRD